MAQVTIPNRPLGSDTRSIAAMLANFDAITAQFNGSTDGDNLAQAVREAAGINKTGSIRRGKSIIATEESRTNVAYGLLTTPDRVQNVVLPTDGLICVAYHALVKESVSSAARAAIFIGANQLKWLDGGAGAPATQAAYVGATDSYRPLFTFESGLATLGMSSAYTGAVTTGQVIAGHYSTGAGFGLHIESGGVTAEKLAAATTGGPCYIFAAAGTYDISIQFKASSGSVTAKERKLWVWTMGF